MAEVVEAEPAVESTPESTVVARDVPAKTPGKLVLAAVIGGTVIVAGALFGGGLAVGLAVPNGAPGHGQFGHGGHGLPGGDQRPPLPNDNQGGQQRGGNNNGPDGPNPGTPNG